jgi:hypothetical protein
MQVKLTKNSLKKILGGHLSNLKSRGLLVGPCSTAPVGSVGSFNFKRVRDFKQGTLGATKYFSTGSSGK